MRARIDHRIAIITRPSTRFSQILIALLFDKPLHQGTKFALLAKVCRNSRAENPTQTGYVNVLDDSHTIAGKPFNACRFWLNDAVRCVLPPMTAQANIASRCGGSGRRSIQPSRK